jgi:hypothetical protein
MLVSSNKYLMIHFQIITIDSCLPIKVINRSETLNLLQYPKLA